MNVMPLTLGVRLLSEERNFNIVFVTAVASMSM